jgi:hypothetical protein
MDTTVQTDPFASAVIKIIEEQADVIGPLALEQARKVSGLDINWDTKDVVFNGDKTDILGKLVGKYEELFGQISVQVCKESVKKLSMGIPNDQLPASLK